VRYKLIVGEDLFEGSLDFPYGLMGALAVVLGNRNDLGLAVSGGSGREMNFFTPWRVDGIEQINAGGDVGALEMLGSLTDLRDEVLRRRNASPRQSVY